MTVDDLLSIFSPEETARLLRLPAEAREEACSALARVYAKYASCGVDVYRKIMPPIVSD